MSIDEVLHRLESILKITDDMDSEVNDFTTISIFYNDREAIRHAYEIMKEIAEVQYEIN